MVCVRLERMQRIVSLVRTRQWTATAAEAEHETRGGGNRGG